MSNRCSLLFMIVTMALGVCVGAASESDFDQLDFDKDVAPILAGRCLECHSGAEPKGKLDLSLAKGALAGGESGPAIVAGRPDASNLWERVKAGEMPPKHPLPASERAILKAWLAAGAKWGTDPIDRFRYTSAARAGYDWWSLQNVIRSEPPTVKNVDLAKNEIDRFVLAKLEVQGVAPSPPADRRTLIRRLYFDLIGLPPSAEEVESEEPVAAIVNRLLASPHYGERWARHWLDVAHFGESDGFEFDKMRPNAWRYRDWVIDALNSDLAYDEFVRLQIAGDVLRPGDGDAVIATGFLVGGAHDSLRPKGEVMQMIMRQDELEDLVALVSQSFLGLTVNCARCHDHKFDPVRQTDYFRLAAALGGVARGNRDLEAPPAELVAEQEKVAKEMAELKATTEGEGLARRRATLKARAEQLTEKLNEYPKAFAVTPQAAPVMRVLARGNVPQPGDVVAAGGIESLATSGPDFGLAAEAPDAERRVKLAEWVTSEKNPLFARTIVNRVWQHHFGRGLVETPNDLGFSGGQPSYPELLDWLASEFAARQWSLKELHRLIVTSATYQQASQPRPDCLAVDADNRWLWRYAPRRLEAECVRDAMLAVAGQLNDQRGGPSYMDFKPYVYKSTQYYDPIDPEGPEFNRRSIYRFWARGGRNPLLDTFDCPDPSTATPRRGSTTTPLQALALFNNSFTLRMADCFAERLARERPRDVRLQIKRAFDLAYGRQATETEQRECVAFVQQHGLPAFCRVLLNTNGFLYVN